MSNSNIWVALNAKFESTKSRSQGGATFFYITARQVMNRLDEVLGPENWHDDYTPNGEHSVICRLTICLPDGQVITKCDAGGNAGMKDAGDDDKSMFSDAFKRAAVKFGVGRYLYGDGVPRLNQVATLPAAKPAKPVPKTGSELVALMQREGSELVDWAAEHFADYPDSFDNWTPEHIAKALPQIRAKTIELRSAKKLATNGKH